MLRACVYPFIRIHLYVYVCMCTPGRSPSAFKDDNIIIWIERKNYLCKIIIQWWAVVTTTNSRVGGDIIFLSYDLLESNYKCVWCINYTATCKAFWEVVLEVYTHCGKKSSFFFCKLFVAREKFTSITRLKMFQSSSKQYSKNTLSINIFEYRKSSL